MQQVYNFLKEAKTYYLATIKDGKPAIRPLGTINIYNGKLYFQTGKKKDMSKEMIANPNIAISAISGANISHNQKCCRIFCITFIFVRASCVFTYCI